MAIDYTALDYKADVAKYSSGVNEAAVAKIKTYLGIALRNQDSALVGCSDASERNRVRESFLKKKLGLTLPDDELDEAVREVCERMKADRTKARVTFYYLLAEKYGKLGLFA